MLDAEEPNDETEKADDGMTADTSKSANRSRETENIISICYCFELFQRWMSERLEESMSIRFNKASRQRHASKLESRLS